jgi:D-glycero-D-manno-heptose 1,7-bisphosphate phosphatase
VVRQAVFLDRDGVINENRDEYVKRWGEFVFLPGALQALERLAQSPFLIVVTTNQSAIGRGLVSQDQVDEIHQRMIENIRVAGGRIDAMYYCPHAPGENCNCRKPQPGLFLKAAKEWNIGLERSYCVGDKVSDLEAGLKVGCKGILVLTGEGRKQSPDLLTEYQIVGDLQEAVELILADGAQEG